MLSTTILVQTLQNVPHVDLKRYACKWYEIASFLNRFQKGCNCTTAEYSLTDNGFVTVENMCNKDSIIGHHSYIKCKAYFFKNSGNAKLKVQFFLPIKAKYWIIDLAENYGYAVLGHPNRKYLWILSRTPKMEEVIYDDILIRLKEKGFVLNMLRMTKQI